MDTLKITETDGGWHLSGAPSVKLHDTLSLNGELWLALSVYKSEHEYDVGYVCFGAGQPRIIQEDQGLMPVLFEGPDGAAYACVTNPYGTRDQELIRRVGGEYCGKPFPPFVGDALGLDDTTLLMTKTDRTDKLLRFELTKGKRKITKLEGISSAAYLLQDGLIHAVTPRGRHIEMDTSGRQVRERVIELDALLRPLQVSFDGPSHFCGYDDTHLRAYTLPAEGAAEITDLLKLEIYSLWPAIPLGQSRAVLRFTHADGNGFVVMQGSNALLIALGDEAGYVDAAGKRLMTLPAGKHVLTGIAAYGDGLAVMTYDQTQPLKQQDLHVSRVALS